MDRNVKIYSFENGEKILIKEIDLHYSRNNKQSLPIRSRNECIKRICYKFDTSITSPYRGNEIIMINYLKEISRENNYLYDFYSETFKKNFNSITIEEFLNYLVSEFK
jgi:hypothetical protein